MDSTNAPSRLDLLDVARLLVFLQGAVFVTGTIEAIVFSVAFGPAAASGALLTGGAAALMLITASVLRPGSRWAGPARRLTLAAEVAVVIFALIDLALSLFIVGQPLGLVPVLTRLVVPAAVLAILRDPKVRASLSASAASVPDPAPSFRSVSRP